MVERHKMPRAESNRFASLSHQIPFDRVQGLLENWLEFRSWVLDTTLESEEDFLDEDMRLYRLERLIAEEGMLNARMAILRFSGWTGPLPESWQHEDSRTQRSLRTPPNPLT